LHAQAQRLLQSRMEQHGRYLSALMEGSRRKPASPGARPPTAPRAPVGTSLPAGGSPYRLSSPRAAAWDPAMAHGPGRPASAPASDTHFAFARGSGGGGGGGPASDPSSYQQTYYRPLPPVSSGTLSALASGLAVSPVLPPGGQPQYGQYVLPPSDAGPGGSGGGGGGGHNGFRGGGAGGGSDAAMHPGDMPHDMVCQMASFLMGGSDAEASSGAAATAPGGSLLGRLHLPSSMERHGSSTPTAGLQLPDPTTSPPPAAGVRDCGASLHSSASGALSSPPPAAAPTGSPLDADGGGGLTAAATERAQQQHPAQLA